MVYAPTIGDGVFYCRGWYLGIMIPHLLSRCYCSPDNRGNRGGNVLWLADTGFALVGMYGLPGRLFLVIVFPNIAQTWTRQPR